MEVCAILFVLILMARAECRCFEDCERSILDIMFFFFFFFRTLLEWGLVLPSYSCFSLPNIIDHCNLGF